MKHIDKVFKDKLYNQKAPVPEGMWDKIAPALEEESGRSFLWFWFAGIITLIIGALAYFSYTNYQSNNTSSPLASEITVVNEQKTQEADQNLNMNKTSSHEVDSEKDDIVPAVKTTIAKKDNVVKVNKPAKKTAPVIEPKATKTVNQPSQVNVEDIQNQEINLEFEEIVNTDNLYGKPANLIITKSYLSDNGSIIKQSNVSTDKTEEPSYNVFINSEGINAGALLRIVEPLENIPLPAFSKKVKKKINL